MKKILLILAVMVFCITALGYCDPIYTRPPGTETKIYTYTTGGAALSSTVVAGNRIFGFSYSDSSAGSAGIYDDSSTANVNAGTLTNLKGEIKVAAGTGETIMFPFPLELANGLVVVSASTGCLEVYYE